MEFREFNIGDVVTVVSEPYLDCPFSWVDEMSYMCGKTVTIINKRYVEEYRTYGYRISECGNKFIWCGNCFTTVDDDSWSDVEIEDDSFVTAINLEV